MSVFSLTDVTKTYADVVAVDRLNLTVTEGEFVTLLGPSGCGKTTTLRMIAGFVIPTSGKIEIGGKDVTRIPPHTRPVGLVFQNYALFPHMTVAENVAFGLRMRGVARGERIRRVNELLALVKLAELGRRFPSQLSGGQQQRVALARALVIEPEILLLDEPFGALDKQLRDHMRVELRTIQRELGISTVFVTHDQDEAMSMSDRICVMSEGLVQQVGPPLEVYDQPVNRFVADFMGRSNLLTGKPAGDGKHTHAIDIGGTVIETARAVPSGDRLTVMIRPERVDFRPADGAKKRPREFLGRVVRCVYLGAFVEHTIALEGGATILAMHTHHGPGGKPLPSDTPVFVTIPKNAVYSIGD
jgi:spermidine/putrescine ABC transporter ATP-binding subunit